MTDLVVLNELKWLTDHLVTTDKKLLEHQKGAWGLRGEAKNLHNNPSQDIVGYFSSEELIRIDNNLWASRAATPRNTPDSQACLLWGWTDTALPFVQSPAGDEPTSTAGHVAPWCESLAICDAYLPNDAHPLHGRTHRRSRGGTFNRRL
ncbi:hypothetical protein VDGE_30511 [Verticillium dahliae]|uniref:Uncharacterized protein n=1 Tax=Verticillium dahliae TaxID=27337 RepID=A0A444RT25_VERDA|nr:hypothetical protein VDGE_30511 [Verticillium dahliae]